MKKIIVLDTNVFYAFIGEKKLNLPTSNQKIKRNNFNALISDPNNEIAISTATIYEFLVRFRNNLGIIRNGLSFIEDKIKKIYIDPTFPFQITDLCILLALPDSNLSTKINSYMEKKIDIEARFSSFFLGLLIVQCTETYLKTETDIQTQRVLRTYQQCVPNSIKATKDSFILALRHGYSLCDVNMEKVIKDQFNQVIYEFLVSWISFLETVKIAPNPEITENEALEIFEKVNRENHNLKKIHKKKNDRDNNSINDWIAKFCRSASSESEQQSTYIYRLALTGWGIQKIQIDYMEWIMSKMGQDGAKFRKNDILDMFIAIVLKDPDVVLISFDKNMQDFIASIGHISKSYIEQVYDRQW